MIYNIRHDRSRTSEILERIGNNKELSQGWGGDSAGNYILDLKKNDDFIQDTTNYHKLNTTRIPSNLTRIKEFSDGDVLVTPHIPEYGKVSLHVVKGNYPDCYRYELDDATFQNHRIHLSKSYGLDGNISAAHITLLPWKAKLPWMRLPVLKIPQYEKIFLNLIALIEKNATINLPQSQLDEFLLDLSESITATIIPKLREMETHGQGVSFENLCEYIVQQNGYRIEARNRYNAQGGDVDLICTRLRQNFSVFEQGELNLFVQIKKHEDLTEYDAVEQVIKMLNDSPQADGCVMSTGDDFTEDAKNLAEENGIVLLNGQKVGQLLIQALYSKE